jgi:hypothetical protein
MMRRIGVVWFALVLSVFSCQRGALAQGPVDLIHQPYLLDTGLVSRSISFENPTGAPGEGGKAASNLGPGRKGSPMRNVKPGETVQLADIEGPGTIRHIWILGHALTMELLAHSGVREDLTEAKREFNEIKKESFKSTSPNCNQVGCYGCLTFPSSRFKAGRTPFNKWETTPSRTTANSKKRAVGGRHVRAAESQHQMRLFTCGSDSCSRAAWICRAVPPRLVTGQGGAAGKRWICG